MKAREVISKIDGVDQYWKCGARAVVAMKKGAEVDRASVARAFEKQGMKLESLKKETRSRTAVIYEFPAEGLG